MSVSSVVKVLLLFVEDGKVLSELDCDGVRKNNVACSPLISFIFRDNISLLDVTKQSSIDVCALLIHSLLFFVASLPSPSVNNISNTLSLNFLLSDFRIGTSCDEMVR